MKPARAGNLPAVRIEAENEWAWCGERRLELTPRAFAVLRHLVEHAGRLITKDELLATVWRDAIVSDAALASCIRDLRRALGDSSDAPRYIETVHRRGFRFIGPCALPASGSPGGARLRGRCDQPLARSPSHRAGPDAWWAGRRSSRSLHAWLRAALNGQRQLVFVTGEPGIGKTALVEEFLAASRRATRRCASVAGNAWSSTAPAKRICRCSKRSGDWVARRGATSWCRSSSSMRRPG